jgi:hypothetical protein
VERHGSDGGRLVRAASCGWPGARGAPGWPGAHRRPQARAAAARARRRFCRRTSCQGRERVACCRESPGGPVWCGVPSTEGKSTRAGAFGLARHAGVTHGEGGACHTCMQSRWAHGRVRTHGCMKPSLRAVALARAVQGSPTNLSRPDQLTDGVPPIAPRARGAPINHPVSISCNQRDWTARFDNFAALQSWGELPKLLQGPTPFLKASPGPVESPYSSAAAEMARAR